MTRAKADKWNPVAAREAVIEARASGNGSFWKYSAFGVIRISLYILPLIARDTVRDIPDATLQIAVGRAERLFSRAASHSRRGSVAFEPPSRGIGADDIK